VVVETASGLFVAKLHGAAQGKPALVAEIVVAELATCLGLPVPERVLITLGADTPSLDRNDELAQLLAASTGVNLGLRLLDGAITPRPSLLEALDDDFAARVLWLDGFVMNPDRTSANSNVLFWHGRPWLIDHGAALTFQYLWPHLTEQSPREAFDYRAHVFGQRTALLPRYDAALAAAVDTKRLSHALAQVPDAFIAAAGPERSPARNRDIYHAFLWKRLKAPRPFVS
jgi:hypothetical protein